MKKLLLAICFAFLLAGCNNYSEPDAMVNETIKTNLSQKDFVMVHADGTLYVLINKKNRVQYIMFNENRLTQYEVAFMSILVDPDGKPILYEGPLEWIG